MNYIDWHYFEIWPKILTLWRNSILFPFYYFSIPLHVKTLFSPWHRQYVTKKLGFHLDDVIGVIFFNVFARIIGAFMRLITILYGLLFMLADSIIFIIPVIVWPLIPFISLPFYFTRNLEESDEIKYLLEVAGNDLSKLAKILFKLPEGKFILSHLGLDTDVILNNVMSSGKYSHPALDAGSSWIPGQARNDNNSIQKQLTMPLLYKSLAETYQPLTDLLSQNNLKPEDIYQTALWFKKLNKKEFPPLLLDLEKLC